MSAKPVETKLNRQEILYRERDILNNLLNTMRKSMLFLALGALLATSVSSYACDGDKACAMKTTAKKSKSSCCATHMKATKTKTCTKDMKASKEVKACCAKKDMKKS